MKQVDLFTGPTNDNLVASVRIPELDPMPEVIVFLRRSFILRQHTGTYVEGVVYHIDPVIESQDGDTQSPAAEAQTDAQEEA